MLRYIRYGFLAALGLALIVLALANRSIVALKLLPDGIAGFAGFNLTLQLPLFLVVFAGIVAGLLIGFVWEWLREARIRTEGNRAKRTAASLEREVRRLKAAPEQEEDDVLALLEDSRKAG